MHLGNQPVVIHTNNDPLGEKNDGNHGNPPSQQKVDKNRSVFIPEEHSLLQYLNNHSGELFRWRRTVHRRTDVDPRTIFLAFLL